jgi:hypothetical protein
MPLCRIKNCERISLHRKLCFTHNQRWKKGEPDYDRPIVGKGGAKKISALDRFEKFVDRTPTCWGWNGFVDSLGRGHLYIHEMGKIRAHRASYLLHIGEIPSHLVVCHTCDNPNCVNPDHLWLGTRKDNTQDMMNKGRCFYQKRTHCSEGHEYPADRPMGAYTERCKVCKKRRSDKYWAKKRASIQS